MSMEELVAAAQKVQNGDLGSIAEFSKNYQSKFDSCIDQISDADWLDCQNFLCTCVRSGVYKLVNTFGVKLLERKKQINWKKHPEMMHRLFDAILETGDRDDIDNRYGDFVKAMINICQHYKMLNEYQDRMLEVLCCALKNKDGSLQLASIQCAVAYPWKTQIQGCKTMLRHLIEAVQAYPTLTSDSLYYTSCKTSLTLLLSHLCNTPKIDAVIDEVKELVLFCKEQRWTDDKTDKNTLCWMVLKAALTDYIQRNIMNSRILKPFIPVVKELWECDDDELQSTANRIMTSLGHHPDLLGEDDTEAMIQLFLSGQEPNLIAQFTQIYPKHRDKFDAHFDDFVNCLENMETWMKLSAMNFFWEMSKNNAKVFTKQGIELIAETLHVKEVRTLTILVLVALAEKRPNDVIMYDDDAMRVMEEDPNAAASGISFLVHLAKGNQTRTEKYISFLVKLVPNTPSMYQNTLMYNIRIMGQAFPKLLAEHKLFINKMLKEPGLKDTCQMMIDIIEGRSLEGLSEEVAVQRDDIDQLDERVGTTEENVENLGKEVDEQKDKLVKVREDVDKAEERIDDLEVVVDETVEKVEEIDKKTLSHAPRWSRDVSYLLNPEDEHDWRLLARRLGYSADDVRNWATQLDPCMSMLDEWFATHKTSEATHAVLKSLEEMDRMDAAETVGRALSSVEDVAEDEPPELSHPPPIFISYQWGHQDEVKILKKHLGVAGYDAWMDIGQMGGGDKLFAKIDEGIRAAQIVLCCVTEKYAKSPNCNREVNLSTTLGKPVIPLLMEKMQWPPPGAMGPIFGEYLFTRFFQRGDAEKTGDERYWPLPKFQELLMQLRYSIPPDEAIVDEPYKGWWNPPEEVTTIKPREQKEISVSAAEEQKPSRSSPEIFISYQWGKQPQIKALYKRLTGMGYSCWFDIMQMGGGDSLYDKIDKGVRGCDVMLSCVTTKYSKSANCRREVSLADAIKKPIIPLLLEEMTWPPEGPMSMVFTQLLYINFCRPNEDIQDHWECNQFGELWNKVASYLKGEDSSPAPLTDKQNVEQTFEPPKEEDDTSPSMKLSKANSPLENTANVGSRIEKANTSSSAYSVPETIQTPEVAAPKSSCCAIL